MNPEIATHLDRLYTANDRLKELNKDLPDTCRVKIWKATLRITMLHAEIDSAFAEAEDIMVFHAEPSHMKPSDWEKIDYPNNI